MSTTKRDSARVGCGRLVRPFDPMKKHDMTKLPKWAQERFADMERRVASAELTLPWNTPGSHWFTLFSPTTNERPRGRITLFTCSENGTHPVCCIGEHDSVFVGRGPENFRQSNTKL